MTAKRAEFRGASPPRTPTPKSSVPHTPEDIANGATTHLETVWLEGSKVKLPPTVVLDRTDTERLRAPEIREGKKLEALVAEILEVAVR